MGTIKNICYESTKECNLNCDYCISSDNAKEDIKAIDYKKIIKKISEFNPERIVISGGEPFMDPDLMKKLFLIRELCPHAFISVSTNGTVSYPMEKLYSNISCLDFSLPALDKDIYQQMRGKDCVEQVKENIQKAKDLKLNLRLSYTLTKINSGELKKILDFAKEMNIEEVRVGRFFPFRDARYCMEKYELSDEEVENIMSDINSSEYPFTIVPPIKSLEFMENGYLTINYGGEIFLPTRTGKNKISMVEECTRESVQEIQKEQDKIFRTTNMKKEYSLQEMLVAKRIRATEAEYTRNAIEEFYSDRSRIIYSQAFRRLQQKAQVFSLETNSSVRSRLSHSIEVSDVGRLLAQKITDKLIKLPENNKYHLDVPDAEKVISIIENACLLHDIGNPPFGHFGEAAIRKWWRKNNKEYIDKYNNRACKSHEDILGFATARQRQLLADFEQFDGNPQGLRTVLRFGKDEDIIEKGYSYETGMNLTYQTILSCVKYVLCAGEKDDDIVAKGLQKKAGYFQSEKHLIRKMYDAFNLPYNRRFPFVYIMEAADDISYNMSDVADGIEKGVTTLREFVDDFSQIWEDKYKQKIPQEIIKDEIREKIKSGKLKDFNLALVTAWASNMIREAVEIFDENIDAFMEGTSEEIISEKNVQQKTYLKILDVISEYSRQKIYCALEAEEIEIAGYTVIQGILENFSQLLFLTKEEFEFLLNPANNPRKKKLEVESRLLHFLGKKYVDSYKNQLVEWEKVKDRTGLMDNQIEWWLRVHLIVDHVAGMTDEYALKTYQLLKGISVSTF